jgi:hypothetical protein
MLADLSYGSHGQSRSLSTRVPPPPPSIWFEECGPTMRSGIADSSRTPMDAEPAMVLSAPVSLSGRPAEVPRQILSERLRFTTVRDVYEAFATAQDDVGKPASDQPTVAFLQDALARQAWMAAVSLCAYLLSRREAVWWGSCSLRGTGSERAGADLAAIDAAEQWVRDPGEDARRHALRVGMATEGRFPGAWMALGAGWSSGSIVPPELGHVPAGMEQTARAVRAGLLIALTQVSEDDHARLVQGWVTHSLAIATGSSTPFEERLTSLRSRGHA